MFRPRLLDLAGEVIVSGCELSLPAGIESVLLLRQIRVSIPTEQPKATPKKPKEVRYNRPLNKGKVVEVSQSFRFDIINQLANIPARITLYELLKLSKSIREALR